MVWRCPRSRAAARAWPSPARVRASLAAAPMSLIAWRASPPMSAEMRLPWAIRGLSLQYSDDNPPVPRTSDPAPTPYCLYLLECEDGAYYAGIALDVELPFFHPVFV